MGSSLISTAFVLLMFGGCGAYYYFVVYKKMMSPEARAAAFAAAGYRPGETVQASFGGLLLRRDASGGFMEAVMDLRRGETATHVFSNITTHDRLHLTIGIGSAAQNVMFEANARPTIRVQGRVFLQDTHPRQRARVHLAHPLDDHARRGVQVSRPDPFRRKRVARFRAPDDLLTRFERLRVPWPEDEFAERRV